MASTRLLKDQGRALLAKRLAGDFSARIRDRGQSYFSQGRVKILYGTDTELETQVEGSANYAVNFEWKEGVLFASCGCPYFEGGEECKHLWAAILAADARGYLSVPASDPNLYLECDYFGFDEEDEGEEGLFSPSLPPSAARVPVPKGPPAPKPPAWQTQIVGISQQHFHTWEPVLNWPASRQILYAVNISSSEQARGLVISPLSRDALHDGTWKTLVSLNLKREQIAKLPSAEDREILSVLAGAVPYFEWGYAGISDRIPEYCLVPHPLAEKVISIAARAGRCRMQLRHKTDALTLLTWDEGEPWRFAMELRRHAKSGWEISGVLRRGDERINLKDAVLVTPGGLLFTRDHVAPIAANTSFESLLQLKTAGPIRAPVNDLDALLGTVLTLPGLPDLEVPEDVRIEQATLAPRICLRIHAQEDNGYQASKLRADLAFEYEGRQVADHNPMRGFYQAEGRRFVRRDAQVEEAAARLLSELGGKYQKPTYYDAEPKWSIAPSKLPRIVRGAGRGRLAHRSRGQSLPPPRGISNSRCRAASTGSSCTAVWSTAKARRDCRSFWRRCAAARPWCAWTMAPTACCRKSG